MEELQKSEPEKAAALFRKNMLLVQKSSVGDINGVLSQMTASGLGPPPTWFAVQMFKKGVLGLRLDVPRFMVKNGFDPKNSNYRLAGTLIFDLIKQNIFDQSEDSKMEKKPTIKQQMTRDRRYVEMLTFLSCECEFDLSTCRLPDCWTPLHEAAANGLLYMCISLCTMGADVNAIALNDDSMPLTLAVKGGHVKCGEVIKMKGGRESWRRVDDKAFNVRVGWTLPKGMEIKNTGQASGATDIEDVTEELGKNKIDDEGDADKPKTTNFEDFADSGGYTFSCGDE